MHRVCGLSLCFPDAASSVALVEEHVEAVDVDADAPAGEPVAWPPAPTIS
jgi:hypothetical protein